MLTRLLALQQADTAFPSGSFAFSNGVEGLASLPALFDSAALRAFAEATLFHRWRGTDRPALAHAHRAAGDLARLATIDAALEAATLSEPLRTGSQRAGRALLTAHVRLATPGAEMLAAAVAEGSALGHLPTVQGHLWRALGLDEVEAATVAGYQLVAGLAGAAVRLGRIGAIDAQRVVRDVLPLLERILASGVPQGDAPLTLESFAPLADVTSLRGAAGGPRLFSN